MPRSQVPDREVVAARSASRRPLVFLSTLSAVDAFVLRAVCSVHPHVHLVRLTDEVDPKQPPLWRRALPHPWRSLTGRLRDLVQAPARRRMEGRLRRALFDADELPDPASFGVCETAHVPGWRVRDPALHRRIAAMAPGRLLVCGAPWLPSALYATTAHGAYNVHWGIAPEYRGADSIFWALAEGRTDRIGVTIHDLTPRIDAGAIAAQGRVAVDANDDETSLWVKCAHEAAALAASVAAIPGEIPLDRRTQGPGGRSYRYAERTLWRELRAALRRRPEPAPAARREARPGGVERLSSA